MHPDSMFMNNDEQNIIWNKLRQFNFDSADSQIKFSDKLKAETKWSRAFTQRVIEEYRKFIFLCCISPTGAAPSKNVDEAWHLHLTYTKSYWIDLCKNTIGIDLHHHPSKGGEDEDLKHEKWYNETLELYEQIFGSMPPHDIWPQPKQASLRINKFQVSISIAVRLMVILLLVLPFLFIKCFYNIVSPFNLDGPQFLLFYALICISAAYSFYIINKCKVKRLTSFIQRNFPDDTNLFQVAEYLGGKKRSVQAGILDLVRKDLLRVEQDNIKLKVNISKSLPADQNPLLIPLSLEDDGKEVAYKDIENLWYQKTNYSHPHLDRIKEVVAGVSFHPHYLPLTVILLGLARMMEGIFFNRPVWYLILEMIAFFCLMVRVYLITYYPSKSTIISRESIAIFKSNRILHNHHEDPEVTDFVLTGKPVLCGYRERILSGIFLISTTTPSIVGNGRDAGGSGGDGGGGCGGGGCGGGGCGGCGGGG